MEKPTRRLLSAMFYQSILSRPSQSVPVHGISHLAKSLQTSASCNFTTSLAFLVALIAHLLRLIHPHRPSFLISLCFITLSPLSIPWLYYGFLATENPITTVSKIPNVYIDLKSNSILRFYIASYTFDGSFLGIKPLVNDLQVCSSTIDWRFAGHNTNATCNLNVAFLRSNNTETLFYELCKFILTQSC